MRLLERVLYFVLVSAASLPFHKYIRTPAVNHIENGLPRMYNKITRIFTAGKVPCSTRRASRATSLERVTCRSRGREEPELIATLQYWRTGQQDQQRTTIVFSPGKRKRQVGPRSKSPQTLLLTIHSVDIFVFCKTESFYTKDIRILYDASFGKSLVSYACICCQSSSVW